MDFLNQNSILRIFFSVTFKRPAISYKDTFTDGQVYGKNTDEIRIKYGINTEKIYKEMAHNPYIKTHEIAQNTGLAQRTVEKIIAKLKKEGIIKRIGSLKTGIWKVE